MRVLLSGGIRTENIVTSINSQFRASGDDFVIIRYLEEIEEIFSRGDYFDKAVICEQSITRDNNIQDEYELRNRINDFALKMQRNPRKLNFVFLTQTPDMANIVHEEIFPIADDSVVVMKAPRYDANFFATLIVNDIRQLPPNLIYVPQLIIPDPEPEPEEGILDFGAEVDEKPLDTIKSIGSLADEAIDIDGINPIQQSEELPFNMLSKKDEPMGTFDFEYDAETEIPAQGQESSIIKGFDSTTSVILEKHREEDYTPTPTDFTRNIEQPMNEYNGNINNIPGFDTETDNSFDGGMYGTPDQGMEDPYNNGYGTPDQGNNFSGDMYGTPDQYNNGYGTPDQGNAFGNTDSYGNGMGNAFGDAFGGDMYGETQADTNNDTYSYSVQDQGNAFGGGYDNTGTDNTEENDYDSAMKSAFQNDYNQEPDNGMGPNGLLAGGALMGAAMLQNEVSQLTAAEPLMVGNQQSMMQTPAMAAPKKKGLLGRFGKGNQNQMMQAPVQQQQQTRNDGRLNVAAIKEALRPFAERGNSIVVTGCGGCGTSVIAYNLANIVSQLGYTVLLVDMDTEGRTQSYISKDNYESMEPDGANLMSAVNSSTGINAHVSVVKTGFKLLTMGLGSDTAPVQDILQREKISRFSNLCKTANNFVIYDVPFNSATNYLADLTYMSDNLVLTIDASNWGVTKTMLNMCNISNDEMLDTMFSRSQIVFNKYRNLNKVLGRKVKTGVDIAKVMDQKVLELIGEDAGFHFEDLHIAGIINDDPDFETSWFDTIQYSDTKKGQEIFLGLLERIVLKR